MNSTQKGFIVPLLIIIIAALAIGGGVYIHYQNKKIAEQTNLTINSETDNGGPVSTLKNFNESSTTTTTANVSLKTFTDSANDLSFKYPSNWDVIHLSYPGGLEIHKTDDPGKVILSGNPVINSCDKLRSQLTQAAQASVRGCFQLNPNNPFSVFYATDNDQEELNVLNIIKSSLKAGVDFRG